VLTALLALPTLLVVRQVVRQVVRHQHRTTDGVTTEEAGDDSAQAGVRMEHTVVRNPELVVAFLALMALLAFVTWAAIRAKTGDEKATPPARESNANENTAPR
jgi:hypothetical protein